MHEVRRILCREEMDLIIRECDESFVMPPAIAKRDNYQEMLDKFYNYSEFYVVEDTRKDICGYAVLYANDYENGQGWISLFCIKREKQGRGIGKLLMNRVIEAAKENGMSTIRLEVWNANQNAIGLYLKTGYIWDGRCTEYSSFMRLQI